MYSTYVVRDNRIDNMVKNVGRIHGNPPKGPTLMDNPLGKYFSLPLPDDKLIATYVWIDGTGENLRSKNRTLNFLPKVPEDRFTTIMNARDEKLREEAYKELKYSEQHKYLPPYFSPRNLENIFKVQCRLRATRNIGVFDENLKDLPVMSFNGSATRQAKRTNADMYLFPRAIYRDPIHRGRSILVMCDTYDTQLQPTATNNRVRCAEAYLKCEEDEPWFGIEQELFLMSADDMRPLGWPYKGFPERSSRYYCGVGADRTFGRDLMEAHYKCCLYAGIPIVGLNVEMGPSQWEYQIGPSVGVSAGDDLWMARYILQILAEQYGIEVSMKPKPLPDWMGSGAHVNFSTKLMRDVNGIVEIEKAIEKLGYAHQAHLKLFDPHGGRENAKRLVGSHQVAHGDELTAGVGERLNSIRIHRNIAFEKKGYFEDRRPGANCDPYVVVDALLRTCVLNE
ncbi:glutamine synthetase [Helicoverpa armigera]|uniref:glutamine synthetase n=1 Tax=Helicoverpa armigera TaxID=29058 RepID=UPI003083B5E6